MNTYSTYNNSEVSDSARFVEKMIREENYYNELVRAETSKDRYEKVDLRTVSVAGIKGFETYELKLDYRMAWGYDIIDWHQNKSMGNQNLPKMTVTVDWVDYDGEHASNSIARGYDLENESSDLKSKKILMDDLILKAFTNIEKLTSTWTINTHFTVTVTDESNPSKVYVVELEKGEVAKAFINDYKDELKTVASMIATDMFTPYYPL